MKPFADPLGTLFGRFRASAQAYPGLPAIEVRGDVLSYRELLELTERLAKRLADATGGPPRAVGLLASRTLAAYAGYLAALRLAAVVVPLNPSYPAARNRGMCEGASVDVVVVDDSGAPGAGDVVVGLGVPTVMLELSAGTCWPETLPREPCREAYAGAPDDVAYVLFTSGSTGEPKGVPIRHRNLDPVLAHCAERYAVGPGCRLSHSFDLTFDPSVLDMFLAWGSGATLVVPQPEDMLAPARFVAERKITHWNSVPAVISISHRMRLLPPGSMPDLRWGLFGGEQLTFEQAEAWAVAAPNCTIENVYGPTELAIACAAYRLPADRGQWPRTPNGTVPVGRIYPHLRAVILSEEGTVADRGELCVRGPQRFDGYLNPAHNPGRFVRYADRTATVLRGTAAPAGAWYRTGDLVCGGTSGEMVHLGRLDDQLKISGYRIEPGEIESVLLAYPAVRDVAVLALPVAAGQPGLTAVYAGEALDEGELSAFVQARLPGYMVPRRYRRVGEFPRTVNGKTDRRRLAADLSAETTPTRGGRGAR